jgi:FMN phosphatase YigB (HAD superfamily)
MADIIFDVDGTLCDVSSIRYHVNPRDPRFSGRKRFDLFHAESINCPPHKRVAWFLRVAKEGEHRVIVVTARKEMWRYHTILWLDENDLDYDELLMRADDDNRKDVEVKRDILDELRRRGYEPTLAVDDNPNIIALWKSEGLQTLHIPGWED